MIYLYVLGKFFQEIGIFIFGSSTPETVVFPILMVPDELEFMRAFQNRLQSIYEVNMKYD